MKTEKVFIRFENAERWLTQKGDWYVPVIITQNPKAGFVEVELPTAAIQGGWFHPGNCPKLKSIAKGIIKATTTTTRDGIEVKAGQRWRDLDKRANNRVVVVEHVAPGHACCRTLYGSVATGRSTCIGISRMHNHSTGFELVS